MIFKKGFTLTEILIALVIIGIMASFLLMNFKPQQYNEKIYSASTYKVLSVFGLATKQIFELEQNQCPYARFIVKPAGTDDYEFVVFNKDGSEINATNLMELYSRHIKFESSGFHFCDYTSYCNNANIIGGRMVGDLYIGIEKLDKIKDCEAYRMPQEINERPAPVKLDTDTKLETPRKCWGKLYVDVNGKEKPDEYGKDVYVFGLSDDGIAN